MLIRRRLNFMKKNSPPNLKISLVFDDALDSSDGVAQYVKALGQWLARRGHHVSYLVGQTMMKELAGAPVYSMSRNLQVKFNANRLSMPVSSSAGNISKVLAKEQP